VHPSDVAAIILEPVLGEGGFLTPPPGFMKALRQLADKHGIMIIADEVRLICWCGMETGFEKGILYLQRAVVLCGLHQDNHG
jgi:acetylornithine/succinyldiaminopimelate/putrescine aminotransferase